MKHPLSWGQRFAKRSLDLLCSVVGLLLSGWLIGLAFIAATIDTRKNGFFSQVRVGRNGRQFRVFKLRTMRDLPSVSTTVTRDDDPRITALGRFLRKSKLDELPQLFNVLIGDMSVVGPRPDVPGFADLLTGKDRIILAVRPGITGPASLRFRDEERELARQSDPERYNSEVLYPHKVRINREYVENYSFFKDLEYVIRTVISI